MKITRLQEITLSDASINIHINLNDKTSNMVLSYTCLDCQGYGCRGGCSNSEKLNPEKISTQLDKETLTNLRSIIQNLLTSISE